MASVYNTKNGCSFIPISHDKTTGLDELVILIITYDFGRKSPVCLTVNTENCQIVYMNITISFLMNQDEKDVAQQMVPPLKQCPKMPPNATWVAYSNQGLGAVE